MLKKKEEDWFVIWVGPHSKGIKNFHTVFKMGKQVWRFDMNTPDRYELACKKCEMYNIKEWFWCCIREDALEDCKEYWKDKP